MTMKPLLRVDEIQTYLGESHILQGVSLEAQAGEVVALLGRNGAGKTTTLRSIMRISPPRSGKVTFDGQDLAGLKTHAVARAGIAFVQETRAIFPSLTVEENLVIAQRGEGWTLERVFDEFPRVAARRRARSTRDERVLAATVELNSPEAAHRHLDALRWIDERRASLAAQAHVGAGK